MAGLVEVGLDNVGNSQGGDNDFTGGDTTFGGDITFAPKSKNFEQFVVPAIAIAAIIGAVMLFRGGR